MRWNLTHRSPAAEEATSVEVEADTSSAAIDALRARIPEDHQILYVRRVYDDAEEPPA
jgi:hypothetical protein